MQYGYFKGDKGELTGNIVDGEFYEIVMLEGIYKGQVKLVTAKHLYAE